MDIEREREAALALYLRSTRAAIARPHATEGTTFAQTATAAATMYHALTMEASVKCKHGVYLTHECKQCASPDQAEVEDFLNSIATSQYKDGLDAIGLIEAMKIRARELLAHDYDAERES